MDTPFENFKKSLETLLGIPPVVKQLKSGEETKIHINNILNFEGWITCGKDLKDSADMVYSNHKFVSLMLYGYAIECLFKAIYIYYSSEGISGDIIDENLIKDYKRNLNTHNIESLIYKINTKRKRKIRLKSEEKKILKELEKAVRWSGRYPESFIPEENSLKGMDEPAKEKITGLYNKLYNMTKDFGVYKPLFSLPADKKD